MKKRKPYRIIGAYDSETTNIEHDGIPVAFPILHQLGLLDGTPLIEIDAQNVEEHTHIELYRHTFELNERLDAIADTVSDYVPVILCHNLAFDMYGLSNWLNTRNVRVLAKSARKPITFTILDEDDEPTLVIWDTLIFTQQSLERMGINCGYEKGVGEWDYNLVRTPDTDLTANEIDYATRDIYTLLAWFGWWLRRNPDIEPDKLGLNVVTKTGIVRERRRVRFDAVKGNKMKKSVGQYWLLNCKFEQPESDDELFTMLAATRGGLTFCAMNSASIPFDLVGSDYIVSAYDATSQHPAQLVSHYYPVYFREMPPNVLELAFSLIGKTSVKRVLKHWSKPFDVAFYACFEFTNIRPKPGTIYSEQGIYPLASARYKTVEQIRQDEDNGDKQAYREEMSRRDYKDSAVNAVCAFGKIVSADMLRVYITELTAWEMWQCYEWDSVRAVHGYETGRFSRPADMDVISVMQFYQAKDEFKKARESFYEGGTITNGDKLKELGIAPAIVSSMENGMLSSGDVEATYLSLKADLNAIFGISASNQYRRDTVLSYDGIEYVGEFGICNAPKNPKVWYQFGQRIVGWSRIAQICALELVKPYAKRVINGDTDSIKIVCRKTDLSKISENLEKLAIAIDKGKDIVCSRVKRAYPKYYDELAYIGHYVHEFSTDRFCASWNKAYCTQDVGKDGNRRFSFTLAGIPTRRRESKVSSFIGINGFADRLYKLGWSFGEICDLFLGYNVTYANDVIKLNGRKFPEWGYGVYMRVTDYKGDTHLVAEPRALALYPMSKTVNDTASPENRQNLEYARRNRQSVNMSSKLIYAGGVLDLNEIDWMGGIDD